MFKRYPWHSRKIHTLNSLSGREESPGNEVTGISLFRVSQVITGLLAERAVYCFQLRNFLTATEFPGSYASFEGRVRENGHPYLSPATASADART